MDTETHELIAGYALGALDDADRARAEELLASSAEAREELRSFAEVTAALAVGATGPAPSAGLRDRILEGARAEPQVVVPLAPPVRRGRVAPVLAAASAIAAVVAIGLGLWGALPVQRARRHPRRTRSRAERRERPQRPGRPHGRALERERETGGRRRQSCRSRVRSHRRGTGWEDVPGVGRRQRRRHVGRALPRRWPPGRARWGRSQAGDLVAVTIEDEAGAEQPTSKPIVSSSEV